MIGLAFADRGHQSHGAGRRWRRCSATTCSPWRCPRARTSRWSRHGLQRGGARKIPVAAKEGRPIRPIGPPARTANRPPTPRRRCSLMVPIGGASGLRADAHHRSAQHHAVGRRVRAGRRGSLREDSHAAGLRAPVRRVARRRLRRPGCVPGSGWIGRSRICGARRRRRRRSHPFARRARASSNSRTASTASRWGPALGGGTEDIGRRYGVPHRFRGAVLESDDGSAPRLRGASGHRAGEVRPRRSREPALP